MSQVSRAPLVTVDRRGPAVWLTLSRPEAANALSKGLVDDLSAAVGVVSTDTSVRVVVITGAGKTFCAGADLKERLAMTVDETRAFLDELGGLLSSLSALPCPVIAALNGSAFGGGLELALACDLRVAAEGITMGLVEVRLGIIPGAGGTQRLARIVGVSRAKELILTGRRFDARAAYDLGVVSAVVPAVDLEGRVSALVDEIAAGAPLAVAQAKAAIDGGIALTLGGGLALERRCYETVLGSADRDEGLRAFAEKRAPAFQGK
ncbi:MAG: enoyl-CoA hydratase/isomerase family protein [Deltaproteobacteria bacterium]|nr:enoyl-CoA hydratase/isomerase family protein [Deltaproteobacteria bacterium]